MPSNIFLVIHTEKTGHPKVRKKMLEFGRSLEGRIRPIAAVTTYLSPVYEGTDDFADSLKELDRYFDIAFHGHFLSDASNVRTKWAFDDELALLTKIGFKPSVYAGGWWIMNTLIASLLDLHNFQFDTTINEIGRTSFGVKQYLPDNHRFKEIPTMRHTCNLFLGYPNFQTHGGVVCTSFHDFDLLSGGARGWIEIKKRLALGSRLKSFEEL